MLQSQGNRCAICYGEFKNAKDTCVDHNHKTGVIRGLLCFNCNIALGKFEDNVLIMHNAIEYVSNRG